MSDSIREPWNVAEADFPRAGTDAEKLRFLLNYAVLAPSSRNTQPWLWKITGAAMELYADRMRSLPRVDPGDRELVMSCGAALLHLRLALRHFGYGNEITLLPDADKPDLLARIELGEVGTATREEEVLFTMIPRRHTSRRSFEDRPVPHTLHPVLQSIATREGAWLAILEEDEARRLAVDLIALGDRIQWADKLVRHQLADWIHPRGHRSSDGLPSYAFDPADSLSSIDPAVLRMVNLGVEQADKDQRLAMEAPLLVALGTEGDSEADWLRAGMALERVLLGARSQGLFASFFNQPVEVPALRLQLRDALKQTLGRRGFPQLIFRLGYAEDVTPTPRRAVDEVLL